jgi:hypothetical protein
MPSSLVRLLPAIAAALSASWIVFECFRPRGTSDVWWTLRVGDYIRTHGDVPRTVMWTMEAVRDLPYVCHSWLAALAYSSVKEALGLDAVVLVPTGVALGLFALVLLLARRSGASWLFSVGIADVALYAAMPRMLCRAEVFGYLLLALALNLLASWVRTARVGPLLWLVPLTVLWANTHGSFLILVGLMPLFGAGRCLDGWRRDAFRREALVENLLAPPVIWLALIWLAVVGATLVNPYGIDLIRSTLDQSTATVWKQVIVEWAPLHEGGALPLRFMVPAALLSLALATGWRRLSFVSVLLVLALTPLVLSSYRQLAVFGLGSAYVLADFARGLEPRPRLRAALAIALVALLLGANAKAATATALAARSLQSNPSRFVTREGIDFVRREVRGNVLNRWVLGGVLIYYAYPQVRVAIDSRADPYPIPYFLEYRRAIFGSAQETLAFVNRYSIDHILIDQELFATWKTGKLDRLEGFEAVYGDGRMVVLTRDAELLQRARARRGGAGRRGGGGEAAE